MIRAALDLYADGGFEQTTAADIAARAGVTERTFFRHFTDKREVLFDGSSVLQQQVVDAIGAAPADRAPVDVVTEAFAAAAPLLEARGEFAGQRAAAIATNPGLLERELLKMATLGVAVADALRGRGIDDRTATLAAEAGVTVFRVGFERWIGDPSAGLADCIRATRAALAELVPAVGPQADGRRPVP
jgi:AcrR family transcriptional regulator